MYLLIKRGFKLWTWVDRVGVAEEKEGGPQDGLKD